MLPCQLPEIWLSWSTKSSKTKTEIKNKLEPNRNDKSM